MRGRATGLEKKGDRHGYALTAMRAGRRASDWKRGAIWRLPILRDDLGLLFGAKNADCVLKLLVREIELSKYVDTTPRLR